MTLQKRPARFTRIFRRTGNGNDAAGPIQFKECPEKKNDGYIPCFYMAMTFYNG